MAKPINLKTSKYNFPKKKSTSSSKTVTPKSNLTDKTYLSIRTSIVDKEKQMQNFM